MATSPSYFGNLSDRDQPTLNTVANYIFDARILLQDIIQPYRYDDQSLLNALNITLLEASRARGDFFSYNRKTKGQVPAYTEVDDTYVEIEPGFRTSIEHGIVGHALKRDQEDVQDIRSTAFLNLFSYGLTGRPYGVVAGGSGPNPSPQAGGLS